MHGFLSRDGTSPRELLDIAREQLRPYASVDIRQAHVNAAHRDGACFRITTADAQSYQGRTLLLATGVYDELPAIAGIREFWGRSVFVCPYCDAWEFTGRRIAVIGRGHRAIQLAQELRQWSSDLLICPEDEEAVPEEDRVWTRNAGAGVRSGTITAFEGPQEAPAIVFEDGSRERCDAIFLTAPLRQRYPLVRTLGLNVREDGEIDVDDRGRTLAHGCYAAGDAVTAVHQVTLAAASGVCAAMAINEDLICEEVRSTTLGASSS
jgi:thioredoxin reductase